MMFPQFASTAAGFTRASSLMFRVGTDAHLYDDPHDADIARLLDSKFDAEKVEGMKRLLALMSQGCDVSNFFPQVVKSVASPDLEVKKLVYIYLVHYAEKRPDEALLSINTFQKDLSDLNPLVRAWALRAMSGIQVHVVAPLMLMAAKKCARDPSPYVRRCAANAIPKLYALDKEHHDDALEELVGVLLDDKSAGVVGAAAGAFIAVCPERLNLVALRFRKLCESLPDVEEWGQVFLVDILLRYVVARHGLPGPHGPSRDGKLVPEETFVKEGLVLTPKVINGGQNDSLSVKSKAHHWLLSNTEVKNHISGLTGAGAYGSDVSEDESKDFEVPDDVRLLLQCTSPLLWSRNSAVVLAAAGVQWLMAPKGETKKIVKPLLFLMRSSYDSQYVVLANLATFVQVRPSLFEAYYEDFFIRSSDSDKIRAMKLDILALIATESSISAILQEFQAYVRDPDRQFAANTVSAIGRCARRHPSIALTCMEGLLLLAKGSSSSVHEGNDFKSQGAGKIKEMLKNQLPEKQVFGDRRTCSSAKEDREAVVVTQAVLAIRSIVQQHFPELEKIFACLVRDLDQIKVPAARAVIIWMIGEYGCNSALIQDMLPTIYRYLGACFSKEDVETKLQILNCTSKIVLRSQVAFDSSFVKTALLVLTYLFDLGSCDVNYDVRDRTRMLQQLLAMHLKVLSRDIFEFSGWSGNAISSNKRPVAVITGTTDVHESLPFVENSESILSALPGRILLSTKFTSLLPSLCPERTFLPGSMSHIVHHTAPGYRPLPEPFSMEEPNQSSAVAVIDEDLPRNRRDCNLSEPEELDEDSEYGESYFSGSSKTGSGENSDLKDRYGKEDNGMVHSSASESESSNEAPGELKHERTGSQGRCSRSRSSRNSERLRGQNADSFEERSKTNSRNEAEVGPLISLSDTEIESINESSPARREGLDIQQVGSGGLQVRSTEDLESWLGPSSFQSVKYETGSSQEVATPTGYATLSVGSVNTEPKKRTLLDFTNAEGLEVKYCFSFTASIYSQNMVCVRLFMCNRSSDTLSAISVKSFESGGASTGLLSSTNKDLIEPSAGKGADIALVIPSQEIPALDPDQTMEGNLYIDFQQHLVPVKLAVYCNKKCFPVKLAPDIGALLRPKVMTSEGFNSAESGLSGMFESTRRCFVMRSIIDNSGKNLATPEADGEIISFARLIASRVLQNANVSLVSVTIPIFPGIPGSDAWSLRLRFSGETLKGSMLCLITVIVEANSPSDKSEIVPVLVKVNCEESVFALNLLKRLDKAVSGMD